MPRDASAGDAVVAQKYTPPRSVVTRAEQRRPAIQRRERREFAFQTAVAPHRQLADRQRGAALRARQQILIAAPRFDADRLGRRLPLRPSRTETPFHCLVHCGGKKTTCPPRSTNCSIASAAVALRQRRLPEHQRDILPRDAGQLIRADDINAAGGRRIGRAAGGQFQAAALAAGSSATRIVRRGGGSSKTK